MTNKNKRLFMGTGAIVGAAGIITAIAVPLSLRNKDDDKSGITITADLTGAASPEKTAVITAAQAITSKIYGIQGTHVIKSVDYNAKTNTTTIKGTTTHIRKRAAATPTKTFLLEYKGIKDGGTLKYKIQKLLLGGFNIDFTVQEATINDTLVVNLTTAIVALTTPAGGIGAAGGTGSSTVIVESDTDKVAADKALFTASTLAATGTKILPTSALSARADIDALVSGIPAEAAKKST